MTSQFRCGRKTTSSIAKSMRAVGSRRLRGSTNREASSDQLNGPVIVAMIAVRMVQPSVHEVVDMVAMRYHFVPAIWTMRVRTMDVRRALGRIRGADRNSVLIDVIFVHVVEMTIMKIVHMTLVADCGMAATRTVLVGVMLVVLLGACRHCGCSLQPVEPPN